MNFKITDKKNFIKRLIFDGVLPIIVFALLILLDRLTKDYFETHYSLYESKGEIIDGFFRFRLTHNTGAAFSLAADTAWGQTFFKILTPIAVVIFLIFFVYNGRKNIVSKYALTLVIAGTIGNYIDRLATGYVVDFISVTLPFNYNFPIFNFADIYLCVGIFFVFVYYIFFDKTLFAKETTASEISVEAVESVENTENTVIAENEETGLQ